MFLRYSLTLCCVLASLVPAAAQQVIYVNQAAAPGGDGTSWNTAYRELWQALEAANPTDSNPVEIWVAKGTYKPKPVTVPGRERYATFHLKSHLSILGGFAGNETSPSQRLFQNVTVLSGDIGVPEQNPVTPSNAHTWNGAGGSVLNDPGLIDNVYSVVTGINLKKAHLDNLVVTGGAALADPAQWSSLPDFVTPDTLLAGRPRASMRPEIAGGGAFLWGDAVVNSCRFIKNAAWFGGGVASARTDGFRLDQLLEAFDANEIGPEQMAAELTVHPPARFFELLAAQKLTVAQFRHLVPQFMYWNELLPAAGTDDVLQEIYNGTRTLSFDAEGELMGYEAVEWVDDTAVVFELYRDGHLPRGAMPELVGLSGFDSSIALTHCGFTGNFSHADGAGLFAQNGDVHSQGTQFHLNHSNGEGGAVRLVHFPGADDPGASGNPLEVLIRKARQKVVSQVLKRTGMASLGSEQLLASYLLNPRQDEDELARQVPGALSAYYGFYTLALSALVYVPDETTREIAGFIKQYMTLEGWADALVAEIVKAMDADKANREVMLRNEQMYWMVNDSAPSVFVQARFENNFAASGGAMAITHANADLDGCLFQQNRAVLGGGMTISHFNQVKLLNCVFTGNTATNGFSAILNTQFARPAIVNCTITDNRSPATDLGYAVGTVGGSVALIANSVFWNNRSGATLNQTGFDLLAATRDGVSRILQELPGELSSAVLGVNALYNNCIQSLDTLPRGDATLYPRQGCALVDGPGNVDLDCLRLENGAIVVGGGNLLAGGIQADYPGGNIKSDPLLVDGVRPGPASPLLNAGAVKWIGITGNRFGINSYTGSDFDKNPRFEENYTRISIGAFQKASPATRLYVNAAAAGNGTGTSWANAMKTVTEALEAGANEIWVAKGTYTPTTGTDRSATFTIRTNVMLIGGFAGTESSLSERNVAANPTILSGNIGDPNSDADNSYHVIYFPGGTDARTVIDGFIITKGRASEHRSGGAVLSHDSGAIFRNCTFVDNRSDSEGGAVYAQTTTGNNVPWFEFCVFENNEALAGGAIRSGGHLWVDNSIFRNNRAGDGGAVVVTGTFSSVKNSVFLGNLADRRSYGSQTTGGFGGAVKALSGDVRFMNCTFSGNVAQQNEPANGMHGGAAVWSQVRIRLANSIVHGNRIINQNGSVLTPLERQQVYVSNPGESVVSNNIIEGFASLGLLSAYLGQNFDLDPLFVDAANGNLQLSRYSPAINRGAGGDGPDDPRVDAAGAPRIVGEKIDLGAYEFQGVVELPLASIQLSKSCEDIGTVFELSLGFGTNEFGFSGYQWEVDRQDGAGYVALEESPVYSGVNSETLRITGPSIETQSYRYRVRLSGSAPFVSAPVTIPVTRSVWYVNRNATGVPDGTSWETAFSDLQQALDAAGDCAQIWVAQGTYQPGLAGTRTTNSFLQLRSGVRIYGGFNGTETSLDQRNWRAHPTVISGELGVSSNESDNCRNLIVANGDWSPCDSSAVLDGFILTGASDAAITIRNASPMIRNCRIEDNAAVAVRIDAGSAPVVIGTVISGNRSSNTIASHESSPAFINCLISDNHSLHFGGALTVGSGTVEMINCTIVRNTASSWGSGIQNFGTLLLKNTILWGNRVTGFTVDSIESQQIRVQGGTVSASHCIIEGLDTIGGNNIALNPLFVSPESGDFSLSSYSPAVNAGDAAAVAGVPDDLSGAPRENPPASGLVDIGAYENQAPAAASLAFNEVPTVIQSCGTAPITISVINPVDPDRDYRWQRNTGDGWVDLVNSPEFTIVSGAGGTSLTIETPQSSMEGHQFRFVEQNSGYVSAAIPFTISENAIIYVKHDATGAEDGSSWANAFRSVTAAVAAAGRCNEIWVAAGTYAGTKIELKPGVAILGGFVGTETTREQRDPVLHLTVLLGNGTDPVIVEHHSYHDQPLERSAVVDGFTIRGGSARGIRLFRASPIFRSCTLDNHSAGAVDLSQANPVFESCVFSSNEGTSGGALRVNVGSVRFENCSFMNNAAEVSGGSITAHNATLTFLDCVFESNRSRYNGGAISGTDAVVVVDRCRFVGNQAGTEGGALTLSSSTLTARNSLLVRNHSGNRGGALMQVRGVAEVLNCTIADNTAVNGVGGIEVQQGELVTRNSIIWGNTAGSTLEQGQLNQMFATTTVETSCVQGLHSFAGSGNVGVNPLFVNAEINDYRLNPSSPLIDAGAALDASVAFDLGGQPRTVGEAPDMGAFELQEPGTGAVVVWELPVSQTICSGRTAEFRFSASSTHINNGRWEYYNTQTSSFEPVATDAYHAIDLTDSTSRLILQNVPAHFDNRIYRFADPSVSYATPSVRLNVGEAAVIYVKPGGSGDGSSWAQAFGSLSAALANAGGCSEIWIAAGVYSEGTQAVLKDGVHLYGGFAGTENSRSQRNPVLNRVEVNGNHLVLDDPFISRAAVLDGLVIKGTLTINRAAPVVRGCVFEPGEGGGALAIWDASPLVVESRFANFEDSAVTLTRSGAIFEQCDFENNQAAVTAGAVQVLQSHPVFDRCRFVDNVGGTGGAIQTDAESTLTLRNSLFAGNRANHQGGALYLAGLDAQVVNCTIADNVAAVAGGGIHLAAGRAVVWNSVLWNNAVESPHVNTIERRQVEVGGGAQIDVRSSCVEGLDQLAGNGNIGFDPLFERTAPHLYRLNRHSPLINQGDNLAVATSLDLAGLQRIYPDAANRVDIGAYELQQAAEAADAVRLVAVPESQTVCEGNPVQFVIEGDPNEQYTYNWFVGGGSYSVAMEGNRSILSIEQPISTTIYVDVGDYRTPYVELTVQPRNAIYVDSSASPGGNGSSPATAFNTLDAALGVAGPCVRVELAPGDYTATLPVPAGVHLKGSATPGATRVLSRLSITAPASRETRIEQITFSNGGGLLLTDASPTIANCRFENAGEHPLYAVGGAPLISNCSFIGNTGTSVWLNRSDAVIEATRFENNVVGALAGAFRSTAANVQIIRSTFLGNQGAVASAILNEDGGSLSVEGCTFENNVGGSAIANRGNARAVVMNSLFAQNQSGDFGGAVFHSGTNEFRLVNCTIADNSAVNGGGGIFTQGNVVLLNSILWGNAVDYAGSRTVETMQVHVADGGVLNATNSCIEGLTVYAGNNNVPYNPLFVTGASRYELGEFSPLIDAGNSAWVAGLASDLLWNPRETGASVDIGAFERTSFALGTVRIRSLSRSQSTCVDNPMELAVSGDLEPGQSFEWQVLNGESEWVPVIPDATHQLVNDTDRSILTVTRSVPGTGFYRVKIGDYTSPVVELDVNPITVLHVNPAASSSGDGLSWATAFKTLQEALAGAGRCNEIWVARGTNTSDIGSIRMVPGVRIYGGFAGVETQRTQRNPSVNVTVLESSADHPAVFNDGRNHSQADLDRSAVLDGLTIRTRTSQPGIINLSASPSIQNCVFEGNTSSSIENWLGADALIDGCLFTSNALELGSVVVNTLSSVEIRNCVFDSNTSLESGGAIDHFDSTLFLASCQFINNRSTYSGGAVSLSGNASAVITGSTFLENEAGTGGGALAIYSSGSVSVESSLFARNTADIGGAILKSGSGLATLRNLTIAANTARVVGGVYQGGGTLEMFNSILWANADQQFPGDGESAQFSRYEGTSDLRQNVIQLVTLQASNGNTSVDPLFVNPSANNFSLSAYSPLINAGLNALANPDANDLAGNPRLFDGTVDIGAYELQTSAETPVVLNQLPVNAIGCPGSVAAFSVTGAPATIASITWQYFNGTQFVDVGNNPIFEVQTSAGSSTLLILNVSPAMESARFRLAVDGTDYVSSEFNLTFGANRIIYVKADAAPDGDGSSWATAFRDINTALNAVGDSCAEIWVAEGTYGPGVSIMRSGLEIYGGFAGIEHLRSQRNPLVHVTRIAAGNVQPAVLVSDDLVLNQIVDRTAVLDGFQIVAEENDGIYIVNSSPTIRNCRFIGNTRPSVRLVVLGGVVDPLIENCHFEGNSDVAISGEGSVTVRRSVFSGNTDRFVFGPSGITIEDSLIENNQMASGTLLSLYGNHRLERNRFINNRIPGGSVIETSSGSTRIENCLFHGNEAGDGAVSVWGASVEIVNCTFAGNIGSQAGGIRVLTGDATVYNSIFWGNRGTENSGTVETRELSAVQGTLTVSNSIVRGLNLYSGNGNLPYDPLFIALELGDFRLRFDSPAINHGDNNAASSVVDLDGNSRVRGGVIDLGAYESPATTPQYTFSPMTPSTVICEGRNIAWTADRAAYVTNAAAQIRWEINPGSGFVAVTNSLNWQIGIDGTQSTFRWTSASLPDDGTQVRFVVTGLPGTPVHYVSPATTLEVTGGTVVYVDASAAPDGDGLSWATAFNDLQSALQNTGCVKEIWIAGGVYKPSSGNVMEAFRIPAGVSLYGGFAGTETAREQRDPSANVTVLSGDLGGATSLSVVLLDGSRDPIGNNTVLDGLVIGNGVVGVNCFEASPLISNCIIRGNSSSGFLVTRGSPRISRSLFIENNGLFGAALRNDDGQPVLELCEFRGNSAVYSGGAILSVGGVVRVDGSLLAGNAAAEGGAIGMNAGTIELRSSTVSGNRASLRGGGIAAGSAVTRVYNSILWNNAAATGDTEQQQLHQYGGGTVSVKRSNLEGLSRYTLDEFNAPANNLDVDPRFVFALPPENAPSLDGVFQLQSCSPLLDLADPLLVTGLNSDLTGSSRLFDATGANREDLGAYETQEPATSLMVLQGPASFTYATGGDNQFVVVVSDPGAQFQWWIDSGNGFSPLSDGAAFTGSQTGVLSVVNPALQLNGARFRCAIIGSSGCEIWTPVVTLSVLPNRLYVRNDAPADGDGLSWATAFQSIQAALQQPLDPGSTEIWVAAGTYTGSFQMKSNIAILGGFSGIETEASERDWTARLTVLDGFGTGVGIENSAINSAARLDGFIIRNWETGIRNADGASPVIENCVFRNNTRAVENFSNAKPQFRHCLFEENHAGVLAGAAMFNSHAEPVIEASIFRGNSASNGGAIYNQEASKAVLLNCVLSGNYAVGVGGAIYNSPNSQSLLLVNCTLTGNRAGNSGGAIAAGPGGTLNNCILWNNSSPGAADVSGPVVYQSTITDMDPQFIVPISGDAAPTVAGDFLLMPCSPAIDAGSNSYAAGLSEDLSGNPRRYADGVVDLGAYEFQGEPSAPIQVVSQPQNLLFCATATNTFEVTAIGDALSYAWEVDRLDGSGFVLLDEGGNHSGVHSPVLVITDANREMDGILYRCLITTPAGCSIRTAAAALSVNVNRLYVNAAAAPGGNGLTWATAFRTIQDAMNFSPVDACGTEIWVAQGTYTLPYGGLDLRDQTAIYGGFNGTETELQQRNWMLNRTALSVAGSDYVVFVSGARNRSARLDGFHVENHQLSPSSRAVWLQAGANVTIANCVFRRLPTAIEVRYASPLIENCLFENNGAWNSVMQTFGGVLIVADGETIIDRCIFRGNQGALGAGVGVDSPTGSAVIQNSLFTGNFESAIFNSGTMTIRHATIAANRTANASYGSAITTAGSLQMFNSIVWGNRNVFDDNELPQVEYLMGTLTISNSCLEVLEAPYLGNDNVSFNPQFVDPISASSAPSTNGNFRLSPCSPLVDLGNADLAANIPADLDGLPRFFGQSVDMGAYEVQTGPLEIVSQPQDQSGGYDAVVQFQVAVNIPNAQFQWQVNSGSGFVNLQDDAHYSGTATGMLTLTAPVKTMHGNIYRCHVVADGCSHTSEGAVFSYIQSAPLVENGSLTVAMAGSTNGLDAGQSSLLELAVEPDGDDMTVELVTPPSNGTLVLHADGTFTYTHDGTEQFSDSFVFAVKDEHGNSTQGTIDVAIIEVNLPPTDILLSSNVVAENEPAGTTVGTLSAIDPNSSDTHTFTLVNGPGDEDNHLFVIDGAELRTAAVFDYETRSSYSIRVGATDNGGLHVEKVFNIAVIDLPEWPVGSNMLWITREPGELVIRFLGIPGEEYRIEYTPDLGTPSWQSIAQEIANDDGIVETRQEPSGAQGYYRAVKP